MSEPVCDKCGAYIRFAGATAEAEADNLKAEIERLRSQYVDIQVMIERLNKELYEAREAAVHLFHSTTDADAHAAARNICDWLDVECSSWDE